MIRLQRHFLALWFAVVLLIGLVAASALLPSGSASAAPPRSVSGGTNALGVYAGPGNVDGVRAIGTQVGGTVTYAMDFLDGSSWSKIEDPSWFLSQWAGKGYSMIWAVPMLPKSGASLSTGATGAYNTHFATLARALVAGGQGSSIIRIGWEFNGNWFPWGAVGQHNQFVAYWRQIVTTMRSVPGANFTFEWNPSLPTPGVGRYGQYYPGNAYVDYVGLDIFDEAWQHYPGAKAQFKWLETGPFGLNWLASFSKQHGKPMVFPEWGLGWGDSNHGARLTGLGNVCGGDNPAFVRAMRQWIKTHNVFESTFWNYGSSSVSGTKNPLSRVALVGNGTTLSSASR
jgi:hypothetical protein